MNDPQSQKATKLEFSNFKSVPMRTFWITSLAFFFLGLVLIGVYRAYIAESFGKIFWDFNKLTKSYLLEEIEWQEYIRQAEEQVLKHNNQIARVIVYLSFICFLLGAGFGIYGLIQ